FFHLLQARVSTQDLGTPQQQEYPFPRRQSREFDPLSQGSKCLKTRRNQDRSRTGRGQKALQEGEIFQVIPNQEPLVVGTQPVLHRSYLFLLIGDLSLRQL